MIDFLASTVHAYEPCKVCEAVVDVASKMEEERHATLKALTSGDSISKGSMDPAHELMHIRVVHMHIRAHCQ